MTEYTDTDTHLYYKKREAGRLLLAAGCRDQPCPRIKPCGLKLRATDLGGRYDYCERPRACGKHPCWLLLPPYAALAAECTTWVSCKPPVPAAPVHGGCACSQASSGHVCTGRCCMCKPWLPTSPSSSTRAAGSPCLLGRGERRADRLDLARATSVEACQAADACGLVLLQRLGRSFRACGDRHGARGRAAPECASPRRLLPESVA